jgi:ABC-2 type transport system ATP-binding protein
VVIRGLSKRYGESWVVRDVDLTVRSGQVLGLLGPNGAGKTTTLRMLLGLIRPTSGEVDIFGTRVLAGSPALRRVGAFVEGPGFVPTLSGIDNLKLWWTADGEDWEAANSEAALEVAGLGDAVHRKVKTYSQGMRQRLAIAQAMLGDPDLVVLDEPTNGLDPPQIVEMRHVIARMAARGTTVLVSSHLLSEIEQVCTHVAVMAQGQMIKTGTVEDVIGADRSVAVEVAGTEADMDRAAAAARGLPGISEIGVDGMTLVVELDGISRAQLLRELVVAGIPVAGMAPRKALEQAFLELVS